MDFEETPKYPSRFVGFPRHNVSLGEIQVSHLKARCYANTLLENSLCIGRFSSSKKKHTQIIQSVGIIGAELKCSLQVDTRPFCVVLVGEKHSQLVVDLRVLWSDAQRLLEALHSFLEPPFVVKELSQVFERNHVPRILP